MSNTIPKDYRFGKLGTHPFHIHIEPSRGWIALKVKELWQYRELLYFLTWRDIKVRYKQTLLGVIWAILQPVLSMVVFSLIFGKLAKIGSDGIPYPLFNLAAVVPWTYFTQSLTQSSNSVVGSGNLVTKVYFPRLIMPIAGVFSGLVDFLIAFVILVILIVGYYFWGGFQVHITLGVFLLPFFTLLSMITALGVGMWLSALNVQYRDVRYVVPFLIQFWFYLTPVIYPSSMLTNPLIKIFYGLNPMAGVIEGFRWALLGSYPPQAMIGVSVLASFGILISGSFYFKRMEKNFADLV